MCASNKRFSFNAFIPGPNFLRDKLVLECRAFFGDRCPIFLSFLEAAKYEVEESLKLEAYHCLNCEGEVVIGYCQLNYLESFLPSITRTE
jgi:hypothetical protein